MQLFQPGQHIRHMLNDMGCDSVIDRSTSTEGLSEGVITPDSVDLDDIVNIDACIRSVLLAQSRGVHMVDVEDVSIGPLDNRSVERTYL